MAKLQKYFDSIAPEEVAGFSERAADLVAVGRGFYQRGWVLGTSGNFSVVACQEPLRLAITASGVDKGALETNQILQIDARGNVVHGNGRPSAETLLHLMLVRARNAQAVLHTHSVWSTLLSERFASEGGLRLNGFEMLKGLEGIMTHEHNEWLPIVKNSQDMEALARLSEEHLKQHPEAHGFLIQGHGLYTWGSSLAVAKRHVEILEFLLEVVGRQQHS